MSGSNHRPAGLLWLRVALLVAGVATGLWLSFAPASGLFQVRARTSAEVRQLQGDAAATRPTSNVAGDQVWQDLAKQVADTTAGTSKALLPNLNTELGENDYYFPAGQRPMSQIPGHTEPGATPMYVQVAPAVRPGFLEVTYLPRGVGLRHVPNHLGYPLRPYAVWCFVVGIAAFVLLPHSYYRFPSIRTAEIAVGLVLAGGLAVIWLLPADLPRPLEKRAEVSPEVVARQEQIAKEMASLQKQMQKALPEVDKGTPAERKAKLDAYKALVARHAKLSQEFTEGDTGVESATTQPTR